MASNRTLTTTLKFYGVQDKSVLKTISSISSGVSKLNNTVNKTVKAVAKATAAIAAAAAGAAVAAGTALYKMGADWDKASDTIRIGTGATGKALEDLNKSMENLYKQLPASKDTIATTVADINTLTGASGTALEAYAANAIKAADMLGVDVKSIYTEASKAFNAFNIPAEEMAGKLDHLFKVSQSTGVGIDKLAQGAVAGQATFKTFGYSFEQATSLLGQLEKSGVNANAALAAMKKGATELSKNGAKDLPKAFNAIANAIKNAKTETEALKIATKTFGARGGVELANALREGKLSVDAFTQALEASGESIDAAYQDTADFSEKIQPAMHTLEVAVKPLADSVFEQINRLVPVVAGLVEKYSPIISAKATELAQKVETGMTALISKLEGVDFDKLFGDIADFASRVGSALATIWEHKDDIAAVVVTLGSFAAAIKAVNVAQAVFVGFTTGVKILTGAYSAVKAVIVGVRTAFVALKSAQVIIKALTAAQWLWNIALNANPIGLIVLAIGAVIAIGWLLYDNWDTICEWMGKAWDWVCNGLQVAWDACKSAWNATIDWLSGAWDATCNAVSAAWDWVCGGLQTAWDACKSAWDSTITWLQSAWDSVCTNLQAAFERFMAYLQPAIDVLRPIWEAITAAFSGDWDTACAKLQEAWEKFNTYFEPAINLLKDTWSTVTTAIQSAWETACNWFKSEFSETYNTLSGIIDSLKSAFTTAGDTLRNVFTGAVDWVRGKFDSLLTVLQPIIDAVRGLGSMLDSAKETASGMAGKAWNTVTGWFSSDDKTPDKKAKGGFTHGLTLAGEAGMEAVISFDRRYREANQGYLLTAAEMLGMSDMVSSAPHSQAQSSTTINLGGVSFSPVLHAPSSSNGLSLIDQLRAAVPELADLIEDELAKRAQHRYA